MPRVDTTHCSRVRRGRVSRRILWAGCSERFAAERALRLQGIEVDNGQSPGERGRVVLTFEGEDCTFAREENATGNG